MINEKRLYRSDNAIIAGVCGGLAEYFSLDPTLVRVIAVILLVLGIGSPALIYLVLIVVMPKKPADYSAYVDVDPVDTSAASAKASSQGPVPPAGAYVPPATAPDYTYVPPAGAYVPPNSSSQTASEDASSTPGAAYSAAYCAAYDAKVADRQARRWYMWPIVVVGLILICAGVGTLVARVFPSVFWWSFWPIIVIVCGVIEMFTKGGESTWSYVRLFSGLNTISIGLILLGCTTSIFGWSVWIAIFSLWPLFLVVAGMALLGVSLHSKPINALACFMVFLVLALGCFNYYFGYHILAGETSPVYTRHSVSTQSPAALGTMDEYDLSRFENASLTCDIAASDTTLSAGNTTGVAVTADGPVGLLREESATTGDSAEVVIGFQEETFDATFSTTEVLLSRNLAWDNLRFTGGASDFNADLQGLKVANADFDMGVSNLDITVGTPVTGGSILSVDGGVSNVDIQVPDGVQASITIDGANIQQVTGDFTYDSSSGQWVTPGYFDAYENGGDYWAISVTGGLLNVEVSSIVE